MEVTCGLQTQTITPSVELVTREHGVHRGDIDLVRSACLDGILDEGIKTDHEVFETLDILDVLYKIAHGVLTLGEFHLTVLIPEGLITHAGIGLADFRSFALEEFLGQGVEVVSRHSGCSDDDTILDKLGKLQLCHHIVA